jgi:hypothetical protein
MMPARVRPSRAEAQDRPGAGHPVATSPPRAALDADPPRRRGSAEGIAIGVLTVAVACQPLLRPSGPANSSPVDVLTLASLLACLVWLGVARTRLRLPFAIPVALMTAGGLVAGLAGGLPATAVLAVVQDLVLAAWLFTVANLAARPGVPGLLVRVWACAASIAAAVFVLASLAGITALEGLNANDGSREAFTFGDPNYAGTYFVVSVFVLHASSRPRHRWVRWACYGLLISALVLTSSNGGMLEMLLGTAFLALLALRRVAGTTAAVAAGAAAIAVVLVCTVVVPFPAIQTWARESDQPLLVNTLGRSNNSSGQRAELVGESLQLYLSGSGVGTGPGTTKELLTDQGFPYAKEAHDDYLASLVERGPLGALGLAVLVLVAAIRGRQLVGMPRGSRGLARPEGLVAALLVMAAAGSYYEVLHFRFLWLLLALVAVASQPAVTTPAGALR